MSMSALIKAMGAAAGGISSGMDAAEAAAERKRLRDEAIEDRQFTMSERARALQMRTDMGRAAVEVAPVEIKQDRPDTMDNRDVGLPGEAPLPTAGYDVGGKRFATMTEARTAATEQNSPPAVATRMADVLARSGDPVRAQQLRASSMQEQTADLQLSAAQRERLDAEFNADLDAKVRDLPSLEKWLSDSAADGQGGKTKFKFVPSADGKKQVLNIVEADGSLRPTERVIPNSTDGLALAKAELARMPAERKLAHQYQKAMLERQNAKDASDAAFRTEELGLRRTDMERRASHERRMEGLAAQRAAGNNPGTAPAWDDKADAFLRERYTSKSPDTGAVTVDGKGLQFGKLVALAEAQRNGGDTTTALGAAFQRDALLRAKATNAKGEYDPAKHDKLRDEALARMYAAPGKEPAAKEESPKTDASSKTVTTMADRVSEQTDGPEADKRWVLNKLMGPLDGDNKLADISKNNANPKFRAAAAALLQERKQRAANVGDDIQPQAL